jgi:hypothetical protein
MKGSPQDTTIGGNKTHPQVEFVRKFKRVQRLQGKAKALAEEVNTEYDNLRKVCPHEHLAGALHEVVNGSSLRPFRVCVDCGVTEYGWPFGYRTLAPVKRNVPSLVSLVTLKHENVAALRHGPHKDVTFDE